jgi:WD40 repeat protein
VHIYSCVVPSKAKQRIAAHRSEILAVKYDHSVKSIATCGGDTIKIWDANTGIKLMQFKNLSKTFSCIDYNYDGRLLCAGSIDGSIRLFNIEKNKKLFCSRHLNAVGALGFMHRCAKIISGGSDNCIKVIDCETQKLDLSVNDSITIS